MGGEGGGGTGHTGRKKTKDNRGQSKKKSGLLTCPVVLRDIYSVKLSYSTQISYDGAHSHITIMSSRAEAAGAVTASVYIRKGSKNPHPINYDTTSMGGPTPCAFGECFALLPLLPSFPFLRGTPFPSLSWSASERDFGQPRQRC